MEAEVVCNECGAICSWIGVAQDYLCPNGCGLLGKIEKEWQRIQPVLKIEQSEVRRGGISRVMLLESVLFEFVALRRRLKQ